jgi:hypothetical protein
MSDMGKDRTNAERQKRHRTRVMERLKQAVSGNDLHRAISDAYFEAVRQRVDAFLAELAQKPMEFEPFVRAKILAHMEGWREAFEHDGLLPVEIMTHAVRKAADSFTWECLREDLGEQVLIHSPAEQPDAAA